MKKSYTTKGTCSRQIDVTIEDGIITEVVFMGGCNGNLKGISALCKGKKPEEIIPVLEGITCGFKSTSCPDQLACALTAALEQNK